MVLREKPQKANWLSVLFLIIIYKLKKSLTDTWAHTFLIWWHKLDHVSTMGSIIYELQNRVTHYDVTNWVTNSFLLFFDMKKALL